MPCRMRTMDFLKLLDGNLLSALCLNYVCEAICQRLVIWEILVRFMYLQHA